MRILTNIARVLVGLLFIISGLVKANDPNGLGIKMTEFFNIWKMSGLNSYSLALAIAMIIFEIVAGIAILLGYKIKLFSTLTLLLIIFFTFLTGYAFVTGEPATCGCFGDCIPLTSKESFTKDLILLALALLIFTYSFYVKPIFNNKVSLIVLGASLLGTILFMWYVLRYLPVKDCLAFPVGTNLKQIKYGNDSIVSAPKLNSNVVYIYSKGSDTLSINQEDLLNEANADKYGGLEDSGYVFMKIDTLKPKAKPLISAPKNSDANIALRTGFNLKNADGEEETEIILKSDSTHYLLFVKDIKSESCKNEAIAALKKAAGTKKVYMVSIDAKSFEPSLYPNVGLLGTSDDVAVKAIARSVATLVVIKKGVIIAKYGCADIAKALK